MKYVYVMANNHLFIKGSGSNSLFVVRIITNDCVASFPHPSGITTGNCSQDAVSATRQPEVQNTTNIKPVLRQIVFGG